MIEDDMVIAYPMANAQDLQIQGLRQRCADYEAEIGRLKQLLYRGNHADKVKLIQRIDDLRNVISGLEGIAKEGGKL